MCGIVSNRALEKELFNKIRQKSILFPIRLNSLKYNLPPNSKITVEEIINFHTMAPFFTSFLSSEKTEEIHKAMAEGNKGSIEKLVGIGGSKIKSETRLKYCPLCYQQDVNEIGISYWRRLHQIPGVLYCPDHSVVLKVSNVTLIDYWSDYLCADADTCNSEIEVDTHSVKIKELNMTYIKNVSYLLNENRERKELSFLISFYLDRLRERGLASVGGTIYMKRLVEEFLFFYPSDYLKLMQSHVDVEQKANWLRIFVRYNNKNRSPLRHLLFLQFLGIDVAEIFNKEQVSGKQTVNKTFTPSFDINDRRKEWLKLIEENPHSNRSELKEIGKGLHTWIYRYDREWYNEVTPMQKSVKKRADSVDWDERDRECLELAKKAVDELYRTEGKPKRITTGNIRMLIGVKRWFNNPKLVKTKEYLNEVVEDLDSYRTRKILWAIDELRKEGEMLTTYKIQRKVGFDSRDNHIKELIMKILNE